MTLKNKKNTFAVKIENLLKGDYGKMIRFLPCVDIWWDENISIGISWLSFSIEFWFGDVSELL